MKDHNTRTLEEQRDEFKRNRFLATPLAGTIAWTIVGISGLMFDDQTSVIVLFVATGMIVYLGMFISKFTGEDFLDKSRPKNAFMGLFMQTVVMSLLVYAIAIPFFLQDYTSLPLTVGILTGIMWVPMSWSLQHWVGMTHGILRTALVLAAWYVFPDDRFVVIPAVIVVLYLCVIYVLDNRWKLENQK